MWRWLDQWLANLPYTDQLSWRQARLLQSMLLGLLAMFILGLPISLSAPGSNLIWVFSIAAYILALLATLLALVLVRRGQFSASVTAVSVGLILAIGLNLMLSGIAGASGIVLALALPIAVAGLTSGRRLMLWLAALGVLATIVVGVLESAQPPLAGFLPPLGYPIAARVTAIALSMAVLCLCLDRFGAMLRAALVDLRQANQRLETELSERRTIEATLRASEERYRLIAENTSDLVCIIDTRQRFVYISPSYERVLGYPPAVLLATPAFEAVHPDDLAHVLESWAHVATTGSAQATFRYRHYLRGDWLWFESTGTAALWQGQAVAVVVGRDITERRRLEAQLLQSQKMEAIGRLAGGVAHDFNNLLVAISGYTELARDELPHDHQAHSDLGEVQKAAGRAANLTRQLLAFARRQISDPRPLSLNDILLDMNSMLRHLVREDITLTLQTAPDLWPVLADPVQIEQVLVNLVVNARDGMPDGGNLVIETHNVELDEAYVREHITAVAGPHVLLVVSDNGVGMEASTLQRVFEPFFSTKPMGTGLGLAMCYGIVKQSGGNIWIYSEPGAGTTVKIYLPRAQQAAQPLPTRDDGGEMPHGHETVLLVEDEPAVRELAVRALRSFGYTILEAIDGEDALRVVQSYGKPIDLLLTDVIMPRVGGRLLAEALLAQTPGLKVLFTSGYTDTAIVRDGRLEAGLAFLQKPFTPLALARKVRQVLDAKDEDSNQ